MNRRNFFAALFALPLTPLAFAERPKAESEEHPASLGWTVSSVGTVDAGTVTCTWINPTATSSNAWYYDNTSNGMQVWPR